MKIEAKIDQELYLAKRLLEEKRSQKFDKASNAYYLSPPINPYSSTYFYDNCNKLSKSARILAEDIILNNINLKENNNTPSVNLQNISETLKNNQNELYYSLIDYFTYGYAALEIIKNNETFKLAQIPSSTLKILKIKHDGNMIYLAEYSINNNHAYFKIINEEYPENFTHYNNQKLGECLWIGGDNFYDFYSKPYWLPAREHITTKIALNKLNTKKIEKGNITSGIIHFNDPGEIILDSDAESDADIIRGELDDAGSGLAVLYTSTKTPMKMDYVNIMDNNYEYLSKLSYEADQEILSSFSIPRERLMINDEKESLNSNKTATIWRIYLKYLNVQQLPFENLIKKLIKHLYNLDVSVDIEVPLFSDDKKEETEQIIKLWNNGLLTLKQTLRQLVTLLEDFSLDEYDLTDPLLDSRYYNGQPLTDYILKSSEEAELEKISDEISKIY